MMNNRYLTASEASTALGITRATLYAYASRGQLRSEPSPSQPRERLYLREDIDRLRERKEARRDPSVAAARGLHWGSPVLDSGISLLHDGKLYYRGRDVLKLAESAAFEHVAELLWSTEPGEASPFDQPATHPPRGLPRPRLRAANPLLLFQTALPLAGAGDLMSYDLRPQSVRKTGARIIRLFASIVTGRPSTAPLHRNLQARWAPRNPAAADAIRAALVLCADHELNVSAFTARCAASAGASPYDTVAAALATLKGRRHGGHTERVSALFTAAATPRRARSVIANRLRQGADVPGFGHPLYPAGDPRAAMLLRLASTNRDSIEWRLARALSKAGAELLHEHPNLDFGLVALSRSFRFPSYAPLVLFALGRTAGWIAHAIEQYAGGELIRPRARYNGPPPEYSVPAEEKKKAR